MGKTSNLAVLSNTFDVNASGAVSVGGSTGTAGQVLTSQGSGAAPQWTSLPTTLSGNSLITSSGSTFTVPSGVTTIRAYVFGKGGNGAGNLGGAAAGGGGGSCTWGTIPVSPGDVFTFDVTGSVASLKKGATTYLTANAGSNGSGATGGTGGAVGSVTGGLGITSSGSSAGGAGGDITGGLSIEAAGGGGASGSPVGTGGAGAAGGISTGYGGGGGWGGAGGTGGGGGGAGGGGAFSGHGGGAGGAAAYMPGVGRDITNLFSDILLRSCTSPGSAASTGRVPAFPGPGGGGALADSTNIYGVVGGFGAGGGGVYNTSSPVGSSVGGAGGFGGGGGACRNSTTSYGATGGAGGVGGGGGGAVVPVGAPSATGGTGGSAAVLIFY